MTKDFDNWNIIKKKTENKESRPSILVGDIFWCKFGINIGTEYDGKNEDFARPVLVVKKYSDETVFVLPLTTQIKINKDWYFDIDVQDKKAQIILNQGKTIDTKRLERKIKRLGANTLNKIIESFVNLLKSK